MENHLMAASTFLLSAATFFIFSSTGLAIDDAELQTYIIHVEPPETSTLSNSDDREAWYRSFLPTTTASSGESRMVYSYGAAISGFAARLTEDEVKAMERKEGFLQAHPDRLLPLLTTHTPDFLGLHTGAGLWRDSGLGEGVIVGVLDTGITPGHPSFEDDRMPPPPSKWKGGCDLPDGYICNNKLIGARAFISGGATAAVSTVDDEGHGTHTASTAAGNFVKEADVLGNANGTAVGMAPRAHLAIYKVCTDEGCATADIVAGINAAIEDGVDVMSLSLGGPALPFHSDEVAIAAFGAVEKGVFVSCAAGNSGPIDSSLSNGAPWILTVAASTTDRSIRATVKLGDGQEFDGQSLFQPANFSSTMLPLVLPLAMDCEDGSLDGIDVEGKLIICSNTGGGRIAKGSVVKNAGAAAMILMNGEQQGFTTFAEAHVLPASHVSYADGSKIMAYINSTNKPTGTIIFKGTTMGTSPAPSVAYFSSRGPNSASPGILKPDITGPGVSILAAWPSLSSGDDTNSTFNMISGTSMSTPHLSGIAALIKSARPDWSPAMIKSAIMTTSDTVGFDGKPITDETLQPTSFFAMGAGHVNPSRARDPGLVYDIGPDDYIPYLCGLGYTDGQVGSIVRRKIKCSDVKSISEDNLNYPSITVTLKNSTAVTVDRTVTNVGAANSTYSFEVDAPAGVSMSVRPEKLQFSTVNERKRFTVRFSRSGGGQRRSISEGNLKWVSFKQVVRSPIVVSFE